MFILGLFGFVYWDKKEAEEEIKEKKKTMHKRKVRTIFQFYDSIFPDELRDDLWYVVYWHQMKSEHFILRLFMMTNANALVQHFNPACRAARMFPHLPISRMLMSINDRDVPLRQVNTAFALPVVYFSAGLLAIAYLPEVLQETILDVGSGAVMGFGLIAMYEVGNRSIGGLVAIIILIVGLVILREVRSYYQSFGHGVKKYDSQ